ncbi:hypothetical protein [Mesorhizobium dulcispinae]|uniref:hypothetical protein n=1 Tax=Mesorhizobium dulcispinae TaxID=3072316 RepID=UPI002A23E287|nr:hypothetical protein [Mesorhizobium sp. VK23D]MDX8521122.1 hypothetical protein [Mesorhizobium sp. VK23D]
MKTVLPLLSLVVGASNANATDALPIADGAYMRSVDYCEQFRQGKLDSIEFSVSKGGHYYEFPESGCVVATVKPLRPNRYAVDADCMEAGQPPSQRSFILDVESPRALRIDGMQLISCEPDASTDKPAKGVSLPSVTPSQEDSAKTAPREIPLPSFSARPSQEQSPTNEAKKAFPPTKLIRQWQVANENCRGGSGDDPQTEKACATRDALGRQLEAAKWCYGKNGQSGYQYKWHRCGKGSIHY